LHRQIKTAARQALRSLNAEIEARLRQSLGRFAYAVNTPAR
jgi:hypothetical protein